MRLLWFIICLTVFFGCASQQSQRTLEEAVQAIRDRERDNGAALCILYPDDHAEMAFAGWADDSGSTKRPVTASTRFSLASLSKVHLILLSYRLERAGKVRLTDSVRKYLPTLGEEYQVVTLEDLLMHRSGLPREIITPIMLDDVLACWLWGGNLTHSFDSREKFLEILSTPKALHNIHVTENTQYSNLGIGLLGLALSSAMNTSYPELLMEWLIKPEGLTETTFSPAPEETIAIGYAGDIPKLIPRGIRMPTHILGEGLQASGGIYSSCKDYLQIMRCYRREILTRIIDLDTLKNGDICMGLNVYRAPSGKLYLYRYGMMYGSATFVCFSPSTGMAACFMKNNCDWPDTSYPKRFAALLKEFEPQNASN